MNVKDFRAKAYTKNTEGIPVPVNETPSVQKSENNFQKTVFTKDIKAEDLTQKKQSPSQALDNTVDYLKTGGLLKVPVEQTPDGKDSVYRRVAKFLLLIGEDEAAKILPHLSESQIEKIIPEIASIRTVSKEEAAVIMEEFNGLLNKAREEGGVETAREMLEKAYGKKRADELLKKAMPLEGKVPFTYLRDADNERVYLLIKDENPGVQSMVLSHLNPKKAAKIINLMTPEEKKEVVMRLAKMEPVSPDVLRRVDQAMHEKSLNQTVEKAENIDGRNALAQILKKMDAGAENDILTYLSEDDPDLGQDLRSRLFTMDDVVKSDDRFVQEKLREMTEVDIAYLIAAKPDDFREKILSNISAGRRAEVRAQEDILKPMRRSDCERITSEFFSKLRRAFEEGHLIIKDRNDDVFV
ncbi:flagellar motor switch protein FliG [Treponema bryantii]|uniref:flagellar motor switch protein FliG n=1 Tax=Treponema bryantii TaxID=163 RepID=UPI002B2D3271|nr:flagellar motor switch protein FliG [Treponema bryantii]